MEIVIKKKMIKRQHIRTNKETASNNRNLFIGEENKDEQPAKEYLSL
jgi:hypothetical protein